MSTRHFSSSKAVLTVAVLLVSSVSSFATDREPEVVDLSGGPGFPLPAHVESSDVVGGAITVAQLREAGDQLFHAVYNGLDGVGMSRLPDGTPIARFSILPPGGGHPTPLSSQSCGNCHNVPARAAAGPAETNAGIDGGRDGMGPLNPRATTSLFGNGLVQLLAQEMTEALQAGRDAVAAEACRTPGLPARGELRANGVDFGAVSAVCDADGAVELDLTAIEGVDPDLVVRPFGWKGNFTTARVIALGASNNLMGMQAEELMLKRAGAFDADVDGDGVVRELTVGDMTAMVVYGTTQETPQSIGRLIELGDIAPIDDSTMARVARGREVFEQVGCSSCHVPEMHLVDTVFEEPTRRGNGFYFDKVLAAADPGYDPDRPVRYDLLTEADAPRVEPHSDGGAVVRLYGDLKRHRMGRHLADPAPQPPLVPEFAPLKIDGEVVMIDPTAFLTPELWGVGNTGPWMHDARAGTLHEAVVEHGEDAPPAVGDPDRSEAQESRDAYLGRSAADQEALVTFLRSLRTASRESKGP